MAGRTTKRLTRAHPIASSNDNPVALPQYRDHPRHWRDNHYVYPVISRRSRGLSIGVNLNPDAACNFDCIYCQVDRTKKPNVRDVDLGRLRDELGTMIDLAVTGRLYEDEAFSTIPSSLRRVNDIAFSGDGEPTTCRVFAESVEVAAELKRAANLTAVKLVLITDACYLTRPDVERGLHILDAHGGEIWAKLDAGTQAYYEQINRPNHSLSHVIENIIAVARVRPIVIQSMFLRLRGVAPDKAELDAYVEQLRDIQKANGTISYVQVYTVARPPAEAFVAPLTPAEIDRIVGLIGERTGLRAEPFYGSA